MPRSPMADSVFHVIARLNIGGPAIHVALLASGMDRSRYDLHLVIGRVGPSEGDMGYYASERGLTPLVFEDLGREIRPLKDLFLLGRLYRLFRDEKPRIVHTHTAKAGALGRTAAWLAGVPVIVHTFHGHVLRGYFGPIKTRIFLTLERLLARVTSRIITLGEAQADDITALGITPRDLIEVIPLGLDLDPLLEAPTRPGVLHQRLGLEVDTPLVGIVARLVPIKRHEDFLDAAAIVARDHPAAHFVIVGDGECRPDLVDRIRGGGLQERVHLLGWEKDMSTLYPDLDVAVLTSENEGLPTALIEALAAGVPVVSTRVGSVAEIVGAEGEPYLVEPRDVEGIARRIASLLAHPTIRTELGTRGRERVAGMYSSRRMIEDLDRLYSRLLEEAGP